MLAVVTWQVASDGPLSAVDNFLRHRSQMLRFGADPTGAERAAQALADLGGIMVAVPVLALAAGWAAVRRRDAAERTWWHPLLMAAVGLLGLLATVVPAKSLVGRLGPYDTPLMSGQSGFFPSGHAATAAVCFGTALLAVWPWIARRTVRRGLLLAYLGLQGAIGAALVYCDYHWFLDVLGSWCLAAIILWALIRATARDRDRDTEREQATGPEPAGRAQGQGSATGPSPR